MRIRCHKQITGFTLIECMVVTLILMISMGGLIGFRYYSVVSTERAETRLLAARTAQVLTETWKGEKGDTDFVPDEYGFDADFQISAGGVIEIEQAAASEAMKDATMLGNYWVQSEGRRFHAFLAYEDVPAAGNSRILYVVLNWTDRKGLSQSYEFSTVSQTVL